MTELLQVRNKTANTYQNYERYHNSPLVENYSISLDSSNSLYNEVRTCFDIASDAYIDSDENWGNDTDLILEFSGKEYRRTQRLQNELCYSDYPNRLRLLYAGCGTGSLLMNLLTEDNIFSIVGVDYSRRMIELSSELLHEDVAKNNLTLLCGDFLTSFFNESSFDMAICLNNTLGNLVNTNIHYSSYVREDCIQYFHKILSEHGILVLSVYNAECFESKKEYSKFMKLIPSMCDFKNNDFILEFTRYNIQPHLFYTHWFTEEEIVSLISTCGFHIDRLIKRDKRIIVKAKKVK